MKAFRLQRIVLIDLFYGVVSLILVSCDTFSENIEEEKVLRIGLSKGSDEWHHTTQLYQAYQPDIDFEFVTAANQSFGWKGQRLLDNTC